MNTEQSPGRDEEEVLLSFSVEPVHDRPTLERYLRDYPEHTQALVACAAELMLDSARDEIPADGAGSAIDRAWQRLQSIVDSPDDVSANNPFAMLTPTAFKSLAKNLGINNLLLVRLRDRAIQVTTIPRRFVQKLAIELGASAESVLDYLRGPPAMVSGHSFRSAGKPAVTEQISFSKAIESSQLTQAQQDALMAMQD